MKNREEVPFNLSFLDVMCCGFGAVILLVLILSGQVQQKREERTKDLQGEFDRATALYNLARAQLGNRRKEVTAKENTGGDTETQTNERLEGIRAARERTEAAAESAREKERAIKALEKEKAALENATKLLGARKVLPEPGARLVGFTGDGQRQYLTGLKLGGERTLILVDASASMLDELIVNIVRRKLMDAGARREAPKWRRAVRSVHWLIANLQTNKSFQVYSFSTEAHAVIAGTDRQWLSTSDPIQLRKAIAGVHGLAPEKGTSLHNAFAAARQLSPPPDSIILVTDGLPTQGLQATRAGTISGEDRLRLFEAATAQLPGGIPVNTLLFPIEGDPAAAEAFWGLAIATRGSFITPARNWP